MQRVTCVAPFAACAPLVMQRRSQTSALGMEGFSNVKYNTAADSFLEMVDEVLTELDHDDIEDISLSDGVLNIETRKGSFVLNKQAPKAQLWLSSPISGPHHYDMSTDDAGATRWLSDKDLHCLKGKLETELASLLQTKVCLV